ncbi:histone acetyltransferase type B catalytic subunit [Suhomyces tanzawaensis NRRL Y-17324]|uniref:Histone acetyltransferase type B catalytic subunit n=1 Tax=Suhomyces tanzawaensis NRRL Y-17324 TaxID=984487 RepID=A0A1E4SN46_9ASCO|nr:histone acetyltransferase type B catalytic subunit [Suhomyces tanzawaensis NRRL Y-17324]ODV80908.1 histone acetyltransferase type B catalytic subunit [Suhomyces tanzawaensis NRRL Y-17324]
MSSAVSALQPELWTSSSNEVLKIFITDGTGAINFSPEFTYPIFGDAETIYGYKDLVIFLCFDHYTFYPFLNIKYSEKLDDPEIGDLKEKISEFLPLTTVFKDEEKWVDSIEDEKKQYQIPGDLVQEFTKDGEDFSIYKLNLSDVAGLELHKRLQILVLLFIEAGSYIDAGDKLWEVYVLYKKSAKEPSIVGFTTVYNYWRYGGAEKFDLDVQQVRKKISQFIIMPPHQGKGLGGTFYKQLSEQWDKDALVTEIVIEDPNESFDDLRDRVDLKRLNEQIDISAISTASSPEWLNTTRTALKLEKRQFSRLVEMILLYKLKHKQDESARAVRLHIKRRLYEKNKDGLSGLDENTKKDKLQTAYIALEEDYYRILGDIKLNTKRKTEEGSTGVKKKKI